LLPRSRATRNDITAEARKDSARLRNKPLDNSRAI
jgi:hypothetical protein